MGLVDILLKQKLCSLYTIIQLMDTSMLKYYENFLFYFSLLYEYDDDDADDHEYEYTSANVYANANALTEMQNAFFRSR